MVARVDDAVEGRAETGITEDVVMVASRSP
jgi:hypothetical protein